MLLLFQATQAADSVQVAADELMKEAIANAEGLDKLSLITQQLIDFGMMCQGNLLALDPDRVYLYSNTLQSIAMGYLIASLLFLYVRIRVQIGIAAALLLIFWGAMEFITVGNYGGGSYTPDSNLAEWIDRTVLGRFRDGATVENGEVIFATWYRYTWILSSLNFGVTVDRKSTRLNSSHNA